MNNILTRRPRPTDRVRHNVYISNVGTVLAEDNLGRLVIWWDKGVLDRYYPKHIDVLNTTS